MFRVFVPEFVVARDSVTVVFGIASMVTIGINIFGPGIVGSGDTTVRIVTASETTIAVYLQPIAVEWLGNVTSKDGFVR